MVLLTYSFVVTAFICLRTRTRSTFLWFASSTSNRWPSTSILSPDAGTLTTATGLVFFGDDAGMLEAVDGASGHPLWHFNTGQTILASPMTYAVGALQYVTIAAGSDIFSFALRSE